MPRLAELEGLWAEDLPLPPVFVILPLYFVTFPDSPIRNVDLISCSTRSSHWYLCWAITGDVQWHCEVNSCSQQARYKISSLLILRSICWVSSIFLRRREYMELYQASWQQAEMYTTNWKVIWQPVELPCSHLVSTGLATLRDFLLLRMQISLLETFSEIFLLWNFFPVKDLLSPEQPHGIFPHATCGNSYQPWVTYNRRFLKGGFWKQPSLGYYSYRPQNSMFLVHLWKHLGEWQHGWK